MGLLATLALLRGMSYMHASVSAFLIAAWTWFHRPSLLLMSTAFLLAALGCAWAYQRLLTRGLRVLMSSLDSGTARPAAQLLYLEGRDEEARRILFDHLGED